MKPTTTRIKSLIVAPDGDPIFSEMATVIEIEDDAGGEYVKITQELNDGKEHSVLICQHEWPAIRRAVGRILAEIKRNQKTEPKQ
jgi:hypothetical protein